MESRNKKIAELFKINLLSEVNKKTSVSLFDRFGEHSDIFLQQFEVTQKNLQDCNQLRQSTKVDNIISFVESTIRSQEKQLETLLKFDKKKLERAEALTNRVSDLSEDIQAELSFLTSEGGDGNNISHGSEDDTTRDTIMHWRLGTIPDVPASPPSDP
uniref:Uncharacterized protein n=1 Tax=Bovine herpesvirus 4 TaxID=10385 RepID=A0A0F6N4Y4_BHV4|nr:hypothetical protein [Bovine gammaherpesvirus 4]